MQVMITSSAHTFCSRIGNARALSNMRALLHTRCSLIFLYSRPVVSRETCDSVGTLSHREVGSEAVRRMTALGPSLLGRWSPNLWDTWQCVDVDLAPYLNLKLVRVQVRSCRIWVAIWTDPGDTWILYTCGKSKPWWVPFATWNRQEVNYAVKKLGLDVWPSMVCVLFHLHENAKSTCGCCPRFPERLRDWTVLS
jgi:hypothetical protein